MRRRSGDVVEAAYFGVSRMRMVKGNEREEQMACRHLHPPR